MKLMGEFKCKTEYELGYCVFEGVSSKISINEAVIA